MKQFCRAVFALCILSTVVSAQRRDDDDEEDSMWVDSSPDFSDLIVYQPKNTVTIGFRAISGAKTSFGGGGLVASGQDIGDIDTNGTHRYHDGYVLPDQRTMVDSAGNIVPIEPDGRTNNWSYSNLSQITSDGLMAMHVYSASSDISSFSSDPKGRFGVEVVRSKQMGKLFNTRVTWDLTIGASINDLSATNNSTALGTLSTTTDYYDLEGQTPPTPGSLTLGTLLGNTPLGRDTDITEDGVVLHNNWRLRGAYLTFRAGPTLSIPIIKRITATVSAGAVLVYAGTNYSVTQSFDPTDLLDTGEDEREDDDVVGTAQDDMGKLLPGFYVDANLQFNLTDFTGFYVGAIYQSSGSYTHTLTVLDDDDNTTATYASKIDLGSLQGLRAGFSLKF